MNRLLATLGVAQGAPPPARATEPRSPVVHEAAILTPAPEAAAPGGRGVRLAIAGVVAVAVLVVAIVLWRPERSPDARVDAPADTAARSLERQARVESPASEGRLPAGGSGLQALQALTRELATQTTLSDPDLERLADAESNACPNQAPT